MALVGEQAFYNATLPPDQESPHTFTTLDDDFAPAGLDMAAGARATAGRKPTSATSNINTSPCKTN